MGRRSDVFGHIVEGSSYNLIGDGSEILSGLTDGLLGNKVGGAGPAAIDPLLGPLADNGGPTLTHMLLPGSPALNMGDPAFTPPPAATDQRGRPRVASGRIDIGAVERQPPLMPRSAGVAPATVPGGAPLERTRTAPDANTSTAADSRAAVPPTSLEAMATLPGVPLAAIHTFMAAANGSHTVANRRLFAPGPRTIITTDAGVSLAGMANSMVVAAIPGVPPTVEDLALTRDGFSAAGDTVALTSRLSEPALLEVD